MLQTTNTSLVLGNYSDIEETAKRIQMLMRGGEKLSNKEVMALAQFSAVTHLNPFIGECWYISGSGPMVGIAGARRLDQERAAEKNGYSFAVVTPCSPEEAGALESEVKDVVAAFKTEINDSGATAEYQKMFASMIQTMREAGAPDPFAAAKEICGPRPTWVGYGLSKKSDQSRMNKTQLARKRSEADALKKRIVIPFGASVAESDIAPEYVEAEEVKPEPRHTKAQNLTELGFAADVKEVDTAFPPEPAQEEPVTKLMPRGAPADLKARHAELWREASKIGLINPETVKAWSIKVNDTDEMITAKIALIVDALDEKERA